MRSPYEWGTESRIRELFGDRADVDATVLTTDMCAAFFGGTKNYHTDTEESSKMGFDDIVVGGPMSVCYIGDMLTQNIGAPLFTGGRLTIRFVDILWPDMDISVVGSRAEQLTAKLANLQTRLRR